MGLLRQNFRDGWEPEGASFAVFVKSRKVVDIWGGYADKQAARTWKEDTITITFSATKAVAAVCIAILADRGRLKYDDLVTKHWPGFAKNGKENITIEWVLSHMSALPYLDTQITEEMARDHNLMRKVLEKEAPKLRAGEDNAYHAYTYGWLVDQIVRHTDEKHRGIGQFLREELTKPNGIDYHIGLNPLDEYRVARATLPSITQMITEAWYNTGVAQILFSFYYADKVSYRKWNCPINKCTVNSPEQHELEQAAATGIGNARSLASIFSLLVNGRIVSDKTLTLLKKPFVNATDLALKGDTIKGHGFFFYPPLGKFETDLMMGHPGHGCQQVMFDIKNRIAFAYVTNGLKLGIYDLCRNYARLQKALYEILDAQTL
ncbi:beta-lactamase [Teladorsagia circumcincta]|uniref:Beta-lactamase n=1 Tax=Teladorsagia circumcincta TaxID=45464 RepID=A0A2G9UBP7_TELCI|nr:beta-lactamase [Teladorsagia circumcincta]